MAKPYRLAWELTTRAPIEQVWSVFSDTDRFNRVAETGFSFLMPPEADGPPTVKRELPRGSFKRMGLTIAWDEKPFSFRAPRWFRIERDFQTGPAAKLVARGDLSPLPSGGTKINYNVELTPRGLITSAIVGIDVKRTTEPKLNRALREMVRALDENTVTESFGGMPPALTKQAENFIQLKRAELPQSVLVDRLLGFLRAAPERAQSRMAAPTLAQAWNAPLAEVIELMLQATEVGILSMTLDLLCPACLVVRREISEGGFQVHCESCNIRYDASFPELLAVHFKPGPSVRQLRVKSECIGSPAQSQQIVAQDSLAPGEECDLATDLLPGMHQLRTLPALGPPALIEVIDGGGASESTFLITSMIHPQTLRMSRPKKILFQNGSATELTVILERLERPPTLITAGRLYGEFPEFRKLAPVLPFFTSVELKKAVALSLNVLGIRIEEAAAKLRGARLVYWADKCILALYDDLGALLDDLAQVGFFQGKDGGMIGSFAGIALGVTFDADRGQKQVPMGPGVDEAYAAMQGAGLGRVTISAKSADELNVLRALASRRMSTQPHAYLSGDGQPLVELIR